VLVHVGASAAVDGFATIVAVAAAGEVLAVPCGGATLTVASGIVPFAKLWVVQIAPACGLANVNVN